jgi:hypothetical protein
MLTSTHAHSENAQAVATHTPRSARRTLGETGAAAGNESHNESRDESGDEASNADTMVSGCTRLLR